MAHKRLPENATPAEETTLACRQEAEIQEFAPVVRVTQDDLAHADKVFVDGLEIFAHHGVYPEENKLGQKFIVSATVYLDTHRAGVTDKLTDTVSYGSVAHELDAFLRENTFKLLETAAEKTVSYLLEQHPSILGVRLRIEKPWAPVGLPLRSCGVEIERTR